MGLSQRGFGERVGLHGNTIARMERGEVSIPPTLEFLIGYVSREAGVDVAVNSQGSSSRVKGKRAHAKAAKTPSRKTRKAV
jgi:transcriptional regulator with XRE-family HTH domain